MMGEELTISNIKIERPFYENDQLRHDFMYEKPKITYLNSQCKPKEVKCQNLVTSTIPILGWLPRYNMKDFGPDIIAGLTIAIMNIPQGMAYALLAKQEPVVGIYTSFFPVLFYIIFGTSRHNSMGTFAVISLMVAKAVLDHSDPSYFPDNASNNSTDGTTIAKGYSPIQVASSVTMVVAIIQLGMYILRLGVVSVLLSDTLVSGFTTGAAVQVLVSQFKSLLGITLPEIRGYFLVIKTIKSLIEKIDQTNYSTVILSVITILILTADRVFVKPFISKRSNIPIPTELLLIIITTLISKFCYLHEEYGINIVGKITAGFPEPALPEVDLFYKIFLDAVTIAIVSYSISLSMAMIFAQQFDYEVDANQELLAMGAGNMFGSFFSSIPMAASLTRSMLTVVVGGKSQLVALVGSGLLLLVMLWLGPLFELVPRCILASIIVVALKGLLMQVTAVLAFWKLSKMDALIWFLTCLTVIFVGIDVGLLVGVVMSLASIFLLTFKPYTCLLASIPDSDLYLDSKRYKGCREIDGLKIFQYCGGINFATRTVFKNDLFNLIRINPQKEIIQRTKLNELCNMNSSSEANKEKIKNLQMKVNYSLKCIIMDFSTVNCIDPSGVAMLKSVVEGFEKIQISVYISGCTDPVYNLMEKCGLLPTKSTMLRFFPTIHDAVQCYCNVFSITTEKAISRFSIH